MCDFHDYTVSGPGGLMNRLCICMDLGSGVVLEQQTVKWVSVFSEKVHTASKADFFFQQQTTSFCPFRRILRPCKADTFLNYQE